MPSPSPISGRASPTSNPILPLTPRLRIPPHITLPHITLLGIQPAIARVQRTEAARDAGYVVDVSGGAGEAVGGCGLGEPGGGGFEVEVEGGGGAGGGGRAEVGR